MSIIVTECCSSFLDLDFNCDEVCYINDKPYHFACALDQNLITEEELESSEYIFNRNG